MKAKIIGVLVVLAVFVAGAVFYWKATGPVTDQPISETQHTTVQTPSVAEQLPPRGSSIGTEASVIVSDLVSAAATEANTYSADDENFLLDDTGDIDAMGQTITIE